VLLEPKLYALRKAGGIRELGQSFTFTGDDDVCVYIDNKKVIDLGGVHGAASATGTGLLLGIGTRLRRKA
jgi:fibro-slime domain-containing protein